MVINLQKGWSAEKKISINIYYGILTVMFLYKKLTILK